MWKIHSGFILNWLSNIFVLFSKWNYCIASMFTDGVGQVLRSRLWVLPLSGT